MLLNVLEVFLNCMFLCIISHFMSQSCSQIQDEDFDPSHSVFIVTLQKVHFCFVLLCRGS